MIISWYGEGCFKIQNGDTTILTDLPDKTSGLSVPRTKPTVYIQTLTSWPFEFARNEEDGKVIYGGGEYDISGIVIKGFPLTHESGEHFFKTAYIIRWEGISIGLMGHMSEDIPPQMLENFEEVDVLIAPGGGAPFIPQERIVRCIKQLNPKVYIPSFITTAGLKRKTEGAEEIIKACSEEKNITPEEKFVFKKKDLEEIKKTRVICLKA